LGLCSAQHSTSHHALISLEQHRHGVFGQLFESGKPLSANCAVHNPVVEGASGWRDSFFVGKWESREREHKIPLPLPPTAQQYQQ
jgi:hypothetical protein